MQIIDRYTGKILNESNLSGDIELGRYAISMGSSYRELTSKSYKVQEGQRIHQELLDDVNKDKHNIFEIISESVENGDFRSIPLLQGIKNGLEFGDFATNFAMQSARSLHCAPRQIAQAVVDNLDCASVEKMEIAGPGFINFYLKQNWTADLLKSILAERQKKENEEKGKKAKKLTHTNLYTQKIRRKFLI